MATDTAGIVDPGHGGNGLELAARATLADLDARGLLTARDTLTCQLILDLAAVVGSAVRKGQAAAAGMAAKQLLDAIETLPAEPPQDGDAFTALMQQLAQADGTEP